MRRRGHQPGGWFAAETTAGLIIVSVLLVTLTVAVTRHRRASDRLAESRQAIRLAEQTITALQTNRPPPQPPQGITIAIRRLDTPSDVAGTVWVSVTVTYGPRSRDLAGLVRAEAVKGGGP